MPRASRDTQPETSRRGFVRIPVTRPFEVQVGPPVAPSNQPLIAEGCDLSVYGLAFVIESSNNHRPFSTGTVLERLSFKVDGRVITVDAKVQYQSLVPMEGGDAQKVGVEFVNVTADDVWFLSAYIVKAANLKHPPVTSVKKKKKATRAKPRAKAKAKRKAPRKVAKKRAPAKKKKKSRR